MGSGSPQRACRKATSSVPEMALNLFLQQVELHLSNGQQHVNDTLLPFENQELGKSRVQTMQLTISL